MKRLAWFFALALIGAITVSVQLDRQARKAPHLARFVPQPVRGFSQYHLTASQLRSGNAEDALSSARVLVARRPMPAENLRLLAQAQALAGSESDAATAIQLAAQHGWRDPLAQVARMRLALENGDGAEAGRRLAAAWALSDNPEALSELARPVLAVPEARTAFAAMLAGDTRWKQRFLRLGPEVLPGDLFLSTLEDALRLGAKFDCKSLSKALNKRSKVAQESCRSD